MSIICDGCVFFDGEFCIGGLIEDEDVRIKDIPKIIDDCCAEHGDCTIRWREDECDGFVPLETDCKDCSLYDGEYCHFFEQFEAKLIKPKRTEGICDHFKEKE